MLDKELAPDGRVFRRIENPPDGIELMVARPDDLLLLPARLPVLLDDHLGEILYKVRKRLLGQNLFPEIARHRLAGDYRIAGAAVNAAVERQKPRLGALEFGAHVHIRVVHGEMDGAPLRLQERLFRIAVGPVLLDGVFDALARVVVFELERRKRQPVYEHHEIYRGVGV